MSRLVCIPSVGMALVQYCRDTSYLSVSAPLLFLLGRDCNKMMGGSSCGRPTYLGHGKPMALHGAPV